MTYSDEIHKCMTYEEIINLPIEELNLSERSEEYLKRVGIKCLKDLFMSLDSDTAKPITLGRRTLEELLSILKALSICPEGENGKTSKYYNFCRPLAYYRRQREQIQEETKEAMCNEMHEAANASADTKQAIHLIYLAMLDFVEYAIDTEFYTIENHMYPGDISEMLEVADGKYNYLRRLINTNMLQIPFELYNRLMNYIEESYETLIDIEKIDFFIDGIYPEWCSKNNRPNSGESFMECLKITERKYISEINDLLREYYEK